MDNSTTGGSVTMTQRLFSHRIFVTYYSFDYNLETIEIQGYSNTDQNNWTST